MSKVRIGQAASRSGNVGYSVRVGVGQYAGDERSFVRVTDEDGTGPIDVETFDCVCEQVDCREVTLAVAGSDARRALGIALRHAAHLLLERDHERKAVRHG